MAGFLNWLKGSKKSEEGQSVNNEVFKAGQIWSYKTREGEESSRLIIVKVESYETEGVVIHISLNGLRLKNPLTPGQVSETVSHMPFSKIAILKSVTNPESEGNPLPEFMEGYKNWQKSFNSKKGGVFSITISEAVNYLEEAIQKA